MLWSERQKAAGVKLVIQWFAPRSIWRKKSGNAAPYYFKHPNSREGYEAALAEWFQKKKELDGTKPHSEHVEHLQKLYGDVQKWYDAFGVPATEARLADQVSVFLAWLDEAAKKDFPEPITFEIALMMWASKREPFFQEFVTDSFSDMRSLEYQLGSKWIDRIDRATATVLDKEPQTICHWIQRYLDRQQERSQKQIRKSSARDRKYKIQHFSEWCDRLAHMNTIDVDYVVKYHGELDATSLAKDSKEGYFAVFRMFVRWSAQQKGCEFNLPANINNKEFGFTEPLGTGRKRQEKKKWLWTPEVFNQAMKTLPERYQCYLILMLNCGFRHIDLSELRKVDIDWKHGRIVIQRNKLNQMDAAPVISYPLWKRTIELLKQTLSDDPDFAFRNEKGGPVEVAIKLWWKRYRDDHAKGKRLDFIRKTGSTIVALHETDLDDFYLGECLKETSKKHYSFTDGEPCQALDDAVAVLGSKFGYCAEPYKRVALTPDVLEKLQKAAIDVSKL